MWSLLGVDGAWFKYTIVSMCICLIVLCSLPLFAMHVLGKTLLGDIAQFPSLDQDTGLYQGPLDSADAYDWGNCTYWVSMLRRQAGHPIPNTWGNASTWAERALRDGYLVDHQPSAGAIMQISGVANGLGHVAYVTVVDGNGNWTISEMNVLGLDQVDTKILSPQAAFTYNFIH